MVTADCGIRPQRRPGSQQALTRKEDRALVAVSSEGVVTHASQTKRRRSCSPTGTPSFWHRISEIATPQTIWFQNPASSRKSPGLLQLPLLPPGAAQFLASRLETHSVDSSMLALLLPSTARPLPSFDRRSIAAGTFDSLHLLGAPPKCSPSQPCHGPAASQWELQRPRYEVRAAETCITRRLFCSS